MIKEKQERQRVTHRKIDPEYPYLDNTDADIRLVGYSNALTPGASGDSASRLDMYRGHLAQSVVIRGCEFPRIFTGMETDLGRYELLGDAQGRSEDGEILAVIEKYPIRYMRGIQVENPRVTVIWLNSRTMTVDYFNVDTYTECAHGFGFKNVIRHRDQLVVGNFLDKDARFVTSPAREGNQYRLGTNANVAYMTHPAVTEDAMVVSESLAKRMTSDYIDSQIIEVKPGEQPINLYGTEENPKFLPDIGEYVGENGILCAFRTVNPDTFAAEMNPMQSTQIEAAHDRVVWAKPGTRITDLDFYPGPKRDQIPWSIYGQAERYLESVRAYWKSIIAAYDAIEKRRYTMTPRLNSLVTRAMAYSIAHGDKVKGISTRKIKFNNRKGNQIDFLQIRVAYQSTREFDKAFKITDRHGTKGVVAKILPDAHMPVDQQGIRADVLIDPSSVYGRMNLGQNWEPGLNRVSEFVRRKIEAVYAEKGAEEAFGIILDYCSDVNANYAATIESTKSTPEKRKAYVEYTIKHGIYLNVPPYLNTLHDGKSFERGLKALEESDPKAAKAIREQTGFKEDLSGDIKENLFLFLRKKWNVPVSPVTFVTMRNGKEVKVTTRHPVSIGSKYMLLLAKIPAPMTPGIARVSHHGLPVRTPPSLKPGDAESANPVRFGEDEGRIASQDVDLEQFARLSALQSNSPKGVDHIIDAHLKNDHPFTIGRFPISNTELSESNMAIALVHHHLATIGIDGADTEVDPRDFPEFFFPGNPDDTGDKS